MKSIAWCARWVNLFLLKSLVEAFLYYLTQNFFTNTFTVTLLNNFYRYFTRTETIDFCCTCCLLDAFSLHPDRCALLGRRSSSGALGQKSFQRKLACNASQMKNACINNLQQTDESFIAPIDLHSTRLFRAKSKREIFR